MIVASYPRQDRRAGRRCARAWDSARPDRGWRSSPCRARPGTRRDLSADIDPAQKVQPESAWPDLASRPYIARLAATVVVSVPVARVVEAGRDANSAAG